MLINSSNFKSLLRRYNYKLNRFDFAFIESDDEETISSEDLQKLYEQYKKHEEFEKKAKQIESKSLEEQIEFYESQSVFTYSEINPIADLIVNNPNITTHDKLLHLFHGVRFDEDLSKFENILKTRKIYAGKYIESAFSYRDNCNEGEYVSLLDYDPDRYLAISTFLSNNITFIINPKVKAIKTIYLDFNYWLNISNKTKQLKQRYSYLYGEYQVKDYIDFEDIVGVVIPISLELDVKRLLKKYDLVDLPIYYSHSYFDNSYMNYNALENSSEGKIKRY